MSSISVVGLQPQIFAATHHTRPRSMVSMSGSASGKPVIGLSAPAAPLWHNSMKINPPLCTECHGRQPPTLVELCKDLYTNREHTFFIGFTNLTSDQRLTSSVCNPCDPPI